MIILAVILALPVAADPPRRAHAWELLRQEPTIGEVQAAVARREHDPDLLAGVDTSRWAYALPHKVSVRLRQQDESDWSGTLYDDEGWRRNVRGADDFGWQIDLQWDLSKLVHNSDWARAVRERESTRRRQDAAVDLATRLYYERRRLQVRYLLSPDGADPLIHSQLWLEVAELTARLDVLTGGLFRRSPVVWWQPADAPGAAP